MRGKTLILISMPPERGGFSPEEVERRLQMEQSVRREAQSENKPVRDKKRIDLDDPRIRELQEHRRRAGLKALAEKEADPSREESDELTPAGV